jgi:protein-S-isoprenylcysteine O-methyltransferase
MVSLSTALFTFLLLLAIYHSLEYILARKFHPGTTSKDSWLFSKEYLAALLIGLFEFLLEWKLIPQFKSSPFAHFCFILGLAGAILGDCVRKAAIVTNSVGFTHQINVDKRPEHQLCTRGVYSWCRHPGYFGWWVFACSTQVMLCNPVALPLFFTACRGFFLPRVRYEEHLLVRFFDVSYAKYMQEVPALLPNFLRPSGIKRLWRQARKGTKLQ